MQSQRHRSHFGTGVSPPEIEVDHLHVGFPKLSLCHQRNAVSLCLLLQLIFRRSQCVDLIIQTKKLFSTIVFHPGLEACFPGCDMLAKSSFFGPHLCIVDQRLRRSLSEEDMRHSLNADQIIVIVFFVCLDEPVVGNEVAVLAFFIDRRIRSSLPRRNLKLRIGVLLKEDAEKLLLIGNPHLGGDHFTHVVEENWDSLITICPELQEFDPFLDPVESIIDFVPFA